MLKSIVTFLLNCLTLGLYSRNAGKTYLFHMKGGHIVHCPNVASLEMMSNAAGAFSSYSINFAKGKKPIFFSLSIPDIVAVTVAK